MKLKIATISEMKNLTPGALVISDINEHISDFAIFKEYDEVTNTAVVYDCMFKSSTELGYNKNVSEYKEIAIVSMEDLLKEEIK